MRALLLSAFLLATIVSLGQPTANFSWTGHCEGNTTNFTDLSTSGGTILTRAWKINHAATFSTSANPSLTFPNAGCVDITLIVTDANGIDSTTQNVCIDPTPVLACSGANFVACVGTEFCLPCSLKVGNATVGGTINWGDNSTGDFNNPCYTYSNCNPYTLSFTSVDGCPVSATASVTAYCPPATDFDAQETGSYGVHFSDQSQITNNELVTLWNWGFGDATSSNLPNPNHTYPDSGTYQVCLTTTSLHGCVGQACKPVDVSFVVPNFTWTGHCETDVIQFTDASTPAGITSWKWKVDGQTIATSQNTSYSFPDSGCYNVTLVIGGFGETDSVTKQVCIDPTPVWVCDNSPLNNCLGSEFCLPCRFIIDGDTVDGTIDWGDGVVGTFANPCHYYFAPGIYNVTASTSPNGCTATGSVSVTVNEPPTANYTFAQTGLLAYAFTDASTIFNGNIVSWEWDFGDSAPFSTLQNPTHTYIVPGVYTVCLKVTSDQGCSDTICYPVTASQLIPDFSWVGQCERDSIHFTDESQTISPITAWLWKVDGIGVSNVQNLVYAFPDSGCYTVTLTVTSGGETKTDTQEVCIQVSPELVCDNTPYTTCEEEQVCISCHLVLGGNNVETGVDWGDGSPSTTSQCYTYSQCGVYTVSLSSQNPCPVNSSTNSIEITVYDKPEAHYTLVHTGLVVSLTDQSTYDCNAALAVRHINWGDGTPVASPVTVNYPHTFAAIGTYDICLEVVSTAGCTDTLCESVLVTDVSVNEILNGNTINILQQEGNLNVSVDGNNYASMQFNLFNYSGQLIASQTLNGDNTVNFNTSSLAKGFYIIQVVADGQKVSRKIVVR